MSARVEAQRCMYDEGEPLDGVIGEAGRRLAPSSPSPFWVLSTLPYGPYSAEKLWL